MTSPGSSSLSPSRPLDPRRLLLVGVGLPIVVASVTYLLMGCFIVGERTIIETTFGFGCIVLEVGLVGIIVGSATPQSLLRWVLFGWMMVLIDLLVGSLYRNEPGLPERPALSMIEGFWVGGTTTPAKT